MKQDGWPAQYRFEIEEELDGDWADWFDPLDIETGTDGTVLSGLIQDRAALYGTINKIRDLGLSLRLLIKE